MDLGFERGHLKAAAIIHERHDPTTSGDTGTIDRANSSQVVTYDLESPSHLLVRGANGKEAQVEPAFRAYVLDQEEIQTPRDSESLDCADRTALDERWRQTRHEPSTMPSRPAQRL